jgi:xanthine dehydrogenase small subunit
LSEPGAVATGLQNVVPNYFSGIAKRLESITAAKPPEVGTQGAFVGGGTDAYVQKPDWMADNDSTPLFYDENLRGIREAGEYIEIGASATVTDLLESPVMQSIFPDLYKHLKLISSTPIRNMATLAGNFVNASPIGDMTVWFLALDADIDLSCASPRVSKGETRTLSLKDLYRGYKNLAKQPDEIITTIRFKKPSCDFRFNFEKVSKRTYLDISTVNTAMSLMVTPSIAEDWLPPALSEQPASAGNDERRSSTDVPVVYTITDAHVAAGGVAPIPLYLRETSAILRGNQVNEETIAAANEIMQSEISPISDVRGPADYKRLLLRQLFRAHFLECFDVRSD